MLNLLSVAFAAVLLAQPVGERARGEAATDEMGVEAPEYLTAVPVKYGEHPSQSLGINYYPEGPARPVIIYIHSGGWASGPIEKVPPIPELYQKLGLAFAVVGHRTVKEFRDPAQVTDVQKGVRYIKEHAAEWNIDPDRIAVTGRSSGGHLTMWVGFHPDSPKVACILPRSGPTDFHPEFIKTFSPTLSLDQYYQMMFGDVLDDPEEMARIYEYLSPVTYMSKDDPPTLFLHRYTPPPGPDAPANWGAHHHAFGVHGYKKLKEVGGTAELFIGNLEDKGGYDAPEEAFLRKYLLGEKDVKMPPSGLEELEAEEGSEQP